MAKNYDVIIIGAGIGGLYTALNLNRSLRVLILCKKKLELSNSALAQGGIATVYDKQNDSYQQHINDTLVAGGFKNDPTSLDFLVHQGPLDVQKLIDIGVEFDKDEDGEIHLTLEGGHSKKRILHYKDSTGSEIIKKLITAVNALPNVDIIQDSMVCDIKKYDDGFSLKVVQKNEISYFCSNKVVIATGGIGRVFEYTTNSAIATGDGIALAYQLGANIKNISLIQFHPTAFANAKTRECFLISEAVRGEGAYLLNCNYQRFMHKYDDRLELAPRDIVSQSIITESQETNSKNFYLDITHRSKDFLINRFPMIFNVLQGQGIDMSSQKIPIYPCQHYLMGGIDVNINGQTSVDGLYAVGECSHTGVHGNNRLASNSLLEVIVFGRQLATFINENLIPKQISCFNFPQNNSQIEPVKGIRTKIRAIMQEAYFVLKNVEKAKNGLTKIQKILDNLTQNQFKDTIDYYETKSLATIAYLILSEVASE